MSDEATIKALLEENRKLRLRMEELDATLRAIRNGEVDTLVMHKPGGERLLTLEGALEPYRVMVEAMNEGAISLSADGTILYANNYFIERFQIAREKIIGFQFRDMVAAEQRDNFDTLLRQGMKHTVREELPVLAADGKQLPMLFSMNPLAEMEGKAISVIITDLSELSAAAEAQSRLALIVESSDDAIVSATLDGVVQSWNKAAERLFGYSAKEAVGQKIQSLIVPPEYVAELAEKYEAIRRGEHIKHFETVRRRKDGTPVEVSIVASPILDPAGRIIGASINFRDITERKRTETALNQATSLLAKRLKESKCLYSISTIIGDSTLSRDQRVQRVVEAIPSAFQHPEAACVRIIIEGKQYITDAFQETPWRIASSIGLGNETIGTLEVFYLQEQPPCDDGPFLWEEARLLHLITQSLCDFWQRELITSQLQLFRSLVDESNDSVFLVDPDTARILDINKRACINLGYSRDELLRMHVTDIEVILPDEHAWNRHVKAVKEAGAILLEGINKRKDGNTFPVEVSVKYVFREDNDYIIAIARDITERKHAEQILQDEKTFSDSLIQSLPDIFFLIDRQGNLLRWNRKLRELLGLPPEQISQINALTYIHEEDQPLIAEKIQRAFDLGSAEAEARLNLKNGIRYYALTGNRAETRFGTNVIGIGIDITERKRSENALRRANRALQTLSAVNLALVRAASEEELLQAIANIIVEKGGYRLAAVCYAENDVKKSIELKAWSSTANCNCIAQHLSWADNEQGQFPLAAAIRNGSTQICHDIATNPIFAPCREAALVYGSVSNIALPISHSGKTFGGLCILSYDKNAFDDEEVLLLEELASDLSYGIITLRTRKAHEQHETTLRQSLEQSIQAIAATVEARDPYTAGHQHRVAELATAIAREMGLPEEQISGIHLAAMIHDLGKIHVPAEILSKPGKLSDIEFMLIQTHPQAGYDIVKDIKFPWPIADIILQHHEKLDGSGYPQGLKGEQILLEARIITVADVVEAISSHRPYRAGRGIDAAFEELEGNRGTLYDPRAVDVCISLFREQGYSLPP